MVSGVQDEPPRINLARPSRSSAQTTTKPGLDPLGSESEAGQDASSTSTANVTSRSEGHAHFAFLDGLRGLAAVWVVLGHVLSAYGKFPPIISWTSLAVDVFMLLSGFLMVRLAHERRVAEPFELPQTWIAFWLRRLFRIAPLYYVVLLVSVLSDQYVRGFDGSFDYATWDGLKNSTQSFSVMVVSHLTFLFGLLPSLSRSTALPDWSLSLEIQFYALFPLLIAVARRFGWVALSVGVAVICLVAGRAFAPFLTQFTLPSIILLKLNVFLGGMLIAQASIELKRRWLFLIIAVGLMLLPLAGAAGWKLSFDRSLLCVGLAVMVFGSDPRRQLTKRNLGALFARALGSWLLVLIGDLSYGLYLIHLPVRNFWLRFSPPSALPSLLEVFEALVIVLAVSVVLAWVARHAIERPGISLGRSLVRLYLRSHKYQRPGMAGSAVFSDQSSGLLEAQQDAPFTG